MSYTVLFEIARRGRIITYAMEATANVNHALTAMGRHRAAGLASWIQCGNGQVITAIG
jgi:hypothetical protein